jgi:ribosome biogenesis protein Nip4
MNKTNEEKEMELRQLLHNTIDVMTFEQCKIVAESFNFSNEFNGK